MSMRRNLLTTAAAAALVGAMTTGAMAFDSVDWDWTNTVDTSLTVTIAPVVVVPDPTSITEIEKLQVNVGDVTATAATGEIDPPAEPIEVEGILTSATAVGNNQNIVSDTATLLHDAQFAYGGIKELEPADAGTLISVLVGLSGADNPNLGFALGLVAGEALGYITPAEIAATASTTNVDVESDITNKAIAVTNNANWSVDSDLFVADMVQVAIANVVAEATVNGAIFGGLLTNTATAVGNNLNITVGAPVVEAPGEGD